MLQTLYIWTVHCMPWECAIAQSFTMTSKNNLTVAAFSTIHVAKQVIIMLSIADRSFFFQLWTITVLELGCSAGYSRFTARRSSTSLQLFVRELVFFLFKRLRMK